MIFSHESFYFYTKNLQIRYISHYVLVYEPVLKKLIILLALILIHTYILPIKSLYLTQTTYN